MSTHSAELHPLYGLMAEFETPGELVAAARKTREAGFRNFDAYTPYPIHELDGAMDLHDNRVSTYTFIGALLGASRPKPPMAPSRAPIKVYVETRLSCRSMAPSSSWMGYGV